MSGNQHQYMRFPGGRSKALTLSYDDGVCQDKRFVEILNAHGLKCTFNLNGGMFAHEGNAPLSRHPRMTANECRELYGNGPHEVAVHGFTHPHLDQLTAGSIAYEMIKDRETLEGLFGQVVRGMAYPFGAYNDQVVEVLRNCGIVYARTVVSTEGFSIPTDWLRMPATCHHNSKKLMGLAKSFIDMEVPRSPKLFYLWGHTYEFDDNDNWNVIEEFAEYMGGRDDVWYATNMEIYEYVEAYRSLVFSADRSVVKNPSAITLYMQIGKEIKTILPGETVLLS